MEILTEKVNVFGNLLQIELPQNTGDLEDLINGGQRLRISIKEFKPKRSLNANSYMWTVCDAIAKKLRTTAWQIYLTELERYGTVEWLAVVPDALPALKRVYRIVRERGDVTIQDGKKLVRVQVWRGSSTYDTKEMSVLIDGVVNDANEVGADFVSRNDILWKEEKVNG